MIYGDNKKNILKPSIGEMKKVRILNRENGQRRIKEEKLGYRERDRKNKGVVDVGEEHRDKKQHREKRRQRKRRRKV